MKPAKPALNLSSTQWLHHLSVQPLKTLKDQHMDFFMYQLSHTGFRFFFRFSDGKLPSGLVYD